LTILGIAVAVLAVYTFVFRTRPGGPKVLAGPAGQPALAATQATGAGGSTAASAPAAVTPANGIEPAPAAPVLAVPLEWGDDPFVRDFLLVNELAMFKLKAVTIGGDRASALINDQILEEGDLVGGKRIVSIELDRVTLEQGGRTFVLLLGE
jgi:hypothetical protein